MSFLINDNYYIHNAHIVNEGKIIKADVVIQGGLIKLVLTDNFAIEDVLLDEDTVFIDAEGLFLIPGAIDDQVHFREPGLTQKGDILSESKAAVAGGVTSFMEMPNTIPNVLTQELLEDKYRLAANKSLANYSFYMGVSNDNILEVLKTNPNTVCGVKVFLGASTGNMLVDNVQTLEQLFACSKSLIAVHAEDENIIQQNIKKYRDQFGENIPFDRHAVIRSAEACYSSSYFAVTLAKKYNTRLHILHLSTAKELELFDHKTPIEKKRITSEVCVHHLWFNYLDYESQGALIKCNPSIKSQDDQIALLIGLLGNKIDVVASDHAPHTFEEKDNTYFNSPSGIPLVQHGLLMMLELYHQGRITLEKVVEKMSHGPAKCFKIEKRGFIRPGNYADLVLVDLNCEQEVTEDNVLYKCGWSPLEGMIFHSKIVKTFVNGQLVYDDGTFNDNVRGKRLMFIVD
ncbi:MAG: dihydroorotase [Bacteroidota bacterium]